MQVPTRIMVCIVGLIWNCYDELRNLIVKLLHRSGTSLVSNGKWLKVIKAQHKDSGLYECTARNGVDDDLRKIIQVKVRGE